MKFLLFILPLFFILKLQAQEIALQQLQKFVNQKYVNVFDYLQQSGWEFKGVDTNAAHQINTKWTYDYNPETKTATCWLHCIKTTCTDTLAEISSTLTAQQYLTLSKSLLFNGYHKVISESGLKGGAFTQTYVKEPFKVLIHTRVFEDINYYFFEIVNPKLYNCQPISNSSGE